MYNGLPIFKSLNLELALIANPKSAIFGDLFFVRKIFEILISLWIIEFLPSSSKPL